MNYSLLFSVAIALPFAGQAEAANLLVNSGFEAPITADGPPFTGTWEGFTGAGATASNSALSSLGGVQSLRLAIDGTNDTFAGAFQDVTGLSAGNSATVSGFLTTTSSPFGAGVEIRVEWRNSVSGLEISRTPNLTPLPGNTYGAFSQNSTVPAGADTARVVFALQSFGPEPGNTAVLYIDDVSFEVVPEPTIAVSLLLTSLGLSLGRRRRKA